MSIFRSNRAVSNCEASVNSSTRKVTSWHLVPMFWSYTDRCRFCTAQWNEQSTSTHLVSARYTCKKKLHKKRRDVYRVRYPFTHTVDPSQNLEEAFTPYKSLTNVTLTLGVTIPSFEGVVNEVCFYAFILQVDLTPNFFDRSVSLFVPTNFAQLLSRTKNWHLD